MLFFGIPDRRMEEVLVEITEVSAQKDILPQLRLSKIDEIIKHMKELSDGLREV